MKITFTKEQFESLLKLVYLGNWVVNGEGTDSRWQEFDDIENFIFSFADKFGLKDLIEYDETSSEWFASRKLEDEAAKVIDECVEDLFWEELVRRLAWRDVLMKYGDEVETFSEDQKARLEAPFIDKYREEVEKYGVEFLVINRPEAESETIH